MAVVDDKVKRLMEWRDGNRWISPFTLQKEAELVTRTGDEDDELALMLASPAHCIETGLSE